MSTPESPPNVLRQWRVLLKSGETLIVTAERLEPTVSNACAFSVDGRGVVVVPFGTYAECIEIDPQTGEGPHVRRIPAPEGLGASATPPKTGRKTKPREKIQLIRSTPAGDDHYNRFCEDTTVGKIISVLDEAGGDQPVKEVKQRYLEKYGGYPPRTYKRFNDDLAYAIEKKYVVLSEADDVED